MNREMLINVLTIVWVFFQYVVAIGLLILGILALFMGDYSRCAAMFAILIWLRMPDKEDKS